MSTHPPIRQSATFSEYEPFVVAMYVRDALGLPEGRTVPIPKLSPSVQPMPLVAAGDSRRVNEQWLGWWNEILDLAASSFTEGGASIEYVAALSTKPELKALAEPLLDEARNWHAGHVDVHANYRNPVSSDFLPPLAMKLARSVPGRRRRADFGHLAFVVLPVAAKSAWRLGPAFFAVSKELAADRTAFEAWLASELRG